MGAACAVCVFIEIVVCLILCAFKKKEDHSDDEFEYEARFGRYAYPRREYIETEADSTKRIVNDNKRKASSDDILAAFDDDDDDEYDDSFYIIHLIIVMQMWLNQKKHQKLLLWNLKKFLTKQ